jgi:multidrug efflux pump subunit AcrB
LRTDHHQDARLAVDQAVTPAAVARTVLINEGGASVVLGDVADVVDGPEPAISARRRRPAPRWRRPR